MAEKVINRPALTNRCCMKPGSWISVSAKSPRAGSPFWPWILAGGWASAAGGDQGVPVVGTDLW